ncbi:unnamed protein product [Clonostachys rosea]|uniref:Uncharacterized protein n=1 Tax=Bionectria ochroleuca TaxID=29856 RepID=A0ABY6UC20_BIOOC|nr:unnamed protein product [Clonostachys rosea]
MYFPINGAILALVVAEAIRVQHHSFRAWASVTLAVSVFLVQSVRFLARSRRRDETELIALCWLVNFVLFGFNVYSSIARRAYKHDQLSFGLLCATFCLVGTELLIVCTTPRTNSSRSRGSHVCPVQNASLMSELTFGWMSPMLRLGYKQYITEEDLWDLSKQDASRNFSGRFQDAWEHEITSKTKPSLWVALLRGFGASYTSGVLLKAAADLLAILQPQLLRFLLLFIYSYQESPSRSLAPGVAIAVGMFLASVAQSLCLHQCFQSFSQTGIKTKASLVLAVYRKSLKLSNEARGMKSTGEIVNLMAVDSQRIQDVTQFSQHLWSAPFQIILCMLLLYNLLGYSMLAGVVVIIATIPANGHITTALKRLQKELMKNKDSRAKLITEVVSNIKSIKLLAWTLSFSNRIRSIRNNQELVTLRKTGFLQTISSFISSVAPFMVACSTFAVRVLVQKEPLTTDIVFPAIALFQLLTTPMAILPTTVSAVTEATVAISRLTAFLTADELQPDAVVRDEPVENIGQESVTINEGTFKWSMHHDNNVLEDINLSAHKGELYCIIGHVGSGKSSLLGALLGDLHKVRGKVTVRGSVAYVAQQPWVLSASIRDNIIFDGKWDPEYYSQTLWACALHDDLTQLPHGDETLVGDQGITLSGGQKARLALARAIYARADIYLLDDCLSAVDQHVGRHLIEHVFGPSGLLKSQTRILATHSTPVLKYADKIMVIYDGKSVQEGTYNELLTAGGDFGTLTGLAANLNELDSELNAEESNNTYMPREVESSQLRTPTASNRTDNNSKVMDIEAVAGKQKPRNEIIQQGGVKWSVYTDYAKANGLVGIGLYLVALVGAQITEIGGNVLLKQWSEENDDPEVDTDIAKFLGLYVGFGFGSAALVAIQSGTLWLWCSIKASRKLHESMILALLRSPMTFFETTPTGQILNRFSSDIYRIDRSISGQFNTLLISTIKALFSLVVIASGSYIFIILAIPLVLIYCYMQRFYLGAKRELKRLDGASRSPVFAHSKETLSGLTTIRAFLQQERFITATERHLDVNMKAWMPSIAANRWLGLRLEFLGSIIILSAAGLAIGSPLFGMQLSAGMAGLMITYAMQMTQSFSSLVRATGEVETNIVSVERVLEYTQLPSEAPDIISNNRPVAKWPQDGSIRFRAYSSQYRPELGPVLQNLSLDFKAGEKIGVVGRTGAGKSSLALSLFRIIEATTGTIDIDDVDISAIGVLDLRQRLTIIPQDASLFEGSIRDNLDPSQEHDDTELWSALDEARLKEHVANMPGGLEAKIYEGGTNLSQGQKQLMSLARAILKPSNVLVLDEATAAVDVETDGHVQESLRKSVFRNRTVITIAHRMNTIIDSDRVVVLDKGQVVEFDTPDVLLQRKGAFYGLVKEAGLLERP